MEKERTKRTEVSTEEERDQVRPKRKETRGKRREERDERKETSILRNAYHDFIFMSLVIYMSQTL